MATRTVIVSDTIFYPEDRELILGLRTALLRFGVDVRKVVIHNRYREWFMMFGIEFIPRPVDREYHDGACY